MTHLPPDMQQQFGLKEVIRDKHDKTYEVHRTAFGKPLSPLPGLDTSSPVLIKIVPKGLRSFDAADADFSSNCCRGRAIDTACPIVFASGRPGSRRPTPPARSVSGSSTGLRGAASRR